MVDAWPESGTDVCAVWKGENIISFDGARFQHGGRCEYQLVGDCNGGFFRLSMGFPDGESPEIRMQIGDDEIRVGRKGVFVNDEKFVGINCF